MPDPPVAHGGAGPRGTLILGIAMSAVMAAATVPQFVVSALAPLLTDAFTLSRFEFGLLTTVIFAVAAVGSPIAGRVVDAVDERVLIAGVFLGTVGAFAGMARAGAYGWLLAAVGIAGLGQAVCNPVTNRVIARAVRPERQGVVTGVKQSGVQAGGFVAGLALPAVAGAVGWREALVAATVVLIATGGWVMWATGAFLAPAAPAVGGRGAGGPLPVRAVVPWLAAYAFFVGGGSSATVAYLALYAHERLDFSVELAGLAVGLVGLVGAVARLGWGYATDRFGQDSVILAVLGAGAVVSVLLLLGADALGGWAVWAGTTLFGATGAAWNVVGMAVVVKRVAAERSGTASGLVMLGFFAGFLGSPLAFGALVDALGTYHAAWGLVGAQFAVATVLAALWHRHLAARGRHATTST